MYLLINKESMDVVAKHPNWSVLYELGIILCPDDTWVVPLSLEQLECFLQRELEMLYISLTLEVRNEYPQGIALRRILLDYLNEIPENRLDVACVSSQAGYAIEWGIEGYCSYVAGKKEPSHEEGLWENPYIPANLERENAVASSSEQIKLKPSIQAPYTRRREG